MWFECELDSVGISFGYAQHRLAKCHECGEVQSAVILNAVMWGVDYPLGGVGRRFHGSGSDSAGVIN